MSLKSEVLCSFNAINQISDTILLAGSFNFSLWGVWIGTVKVQRSFNNGGVWLDVDSWAANSEEIGFDPEGSLYRVICSAYTSGTINGRLCQ